MRRIAHEIGQDLSEEDINDMIRRADEDKDGVISRDEFYELLRSRWSVIQFILNKDSHQTLTALGKYISQSTWVYRLE